MSTHTQDNAPDVMDEVSLHGQGRPGTVLRWNPKSGERHLDKLVWGLLPHDTKDSANALRPIMARAETVAENPLFASAFRDRRAIVPMSVYYQRRMIGGAGQRFAISRKASIIPQSQHSLCPHRQLDRSMLMRGLFTGEGDRQTRDHRPEIGCLTAYDTGQLPASKSERARQSQHVLTDEAEDHVG